MNKIKVYRGESIDTGELVEGYVWEDIVSEKTFILKGYYEQKEYSKLPVVVQIRVDAETVVQAIGLQDCNRVQAFHKDRCRFQDGSGTWQRGVIEWNESLTGYYLQASNGDDEGNQDIQVEEFGFEIIK